MIQNPHTTKSLLALSTSFVIWGFFCLGCTSIYVQSRDMKYKWRIETLSRHGAYGKKAIRMEWLQFLNSPQKKTLRYEKHMRENHAAKMGLRARNFSSRNINQARSLNFSEFHTVRTHFILSVRSGLDKCCFRNSKAMKEE